MEEEEKEHFFFFLFFLKEGWIRCLLSGESKDFEKESGISKDGGGKESKDPC